MEETFLKLVKTPSNGFPDSHIFKNITAGKPYTITGRYMRGRFIVDDAGNELLISSKMFNKFFKEVKNDK